MASLERKIRQCFQVIPPWCDLKIILKRDCQFEFNDQKNIYMIKTDLYIQQQKNHNL